jgi:hypothetical protein
MASTTSKAPVFSTNGNAGHAIVGYPLTDPRIPMRVGRNASHYANDRNLAPTGKVMRLALRLAEANQDNLLRTHYVVTAEKVVAGEDAEAARREVYGSPEVDRLKARMARTRTKIRKASAKKQRTRKPAAKK